jgi:hypothetical protein
MKQKNKAIKRLAKSGYDTNTIVNYWKVLGQRLLQNNVLVQRLYNSMHYNSTIVPFLLSERNRIAGYFDLNDVKIRRERQNFGKDIPGLVAELRYVPIIPMEQLVNGDDSQKCFSQGVSVAPVTTTYRITKKTVMQPIELSNAQLRCIREGKEDQYDWMLLNYVAAAVSAFAIDVETELFSKVNGKYKYIGDLPNKNSITTRPAGEDIALFRADGITPNPLGEAKINMDLAQANLPIGQMAWFGGDLLAYYATLKRWSGINSQGFNAQLFDVINRGDYRSIHSTTITAKSGLQDPLMIMRPGALQILTANENVGDFAYTSEDHKRYTIVDPIFGLTWDVVENLVKCDTEIKTTIQLSIHWALIGYPDCENLYGPTRKNVKDILLYNIICQDTSACDMPRTVFDPPAYSKDAVSVCNNDGQSCLPESCSVSLSASINQAGGLVVNASFTGAVGDTGEISYSWGINGSPLLATGNVLIIPQGAWDNGDVVTVSVNQGNCNTNAQLVVSEPCPSILVEYFNTLGVGVQLSANGTFNAGDQVRGNIGFLRITNNSNNTATMVVTAVSEINGVLSLGAFTVPNTLSAGFSFDIPLSIPNALANANYTATFSISSNDCDTPLFNTNIDLRVVTA